MIHRKAIGFLVAGMILTAGTAAASSITTLVGATTVNIHKTDGTLVEVDGLFSDPFTRDLDFDATATFKDAGPETVGWGPIGDEFAAGAVGTGWRLRQQGGSNVTTIGDIWVFEVLSDVQITGLKLDAAGGNTVFDVFDNETGTPGSSGGGDLDIRSIDANVGSRGIVDVTLTDAVARTGFDPVGDLYGTLLFDFTEINLVSGTFGGIPGSGSFQENNALRFTIDTDTIAPSVVVPVPAALPLLATALGALGLISRRRQRHLFI